MSQIQARVTVVSVAADKITVTQPRMEFEEPLGDVDVPFAELHPDDVAVAQAASGDEVVVLRIDSDFADQAGLL